MVTALPFAFNLCGLGSAHWDLKTTIACWPKQGASIECFYSAWWHAFGDPIPAINRMLKEGCIIHNICFQVWWDEVPSQQSPHRLVPLDVLGHALPHLQRFATNHAYLRTYVSHSCEYVSQDRPAIKRRVDMVKKLAPSCVPVLTPGKKNGVWSPVLPNMIVDWHGLDAKSRRGDLAALDGTSVYDLTTEQLAKWKYDNRLAEFASLYVPRCSCVSGAPGQRPFPDQRTLSPTRDDYAAMIALTLDV